MQEEKSSRRGRSSQLNYTENETPARPLVDLLALPQMAPRPEISLGGLSTDEAASRHGAHRGRVQLATHTETGIMPSNHTETIVHSDADLGLL